MSESSDAKRQRRVREAVQQYEASLAGQTARLNKMYGDEPSWVPGAYGPVYVGTEAAKRTFESGATRDVDTDKLDYEGFLSPLVLEEFAKYMHEHRHMKDGSLRASDNWKQGIPQSVYLKSLVRHMMDVWLLGGGHEVVRPEDGSRPNLKEALLAVMFNAMGYLHELLRNE